MISLVNNYNSTSRNNQYVNFKGVSDFTQLQPVYDNPDWYAAMQLNENINQMTNLMPQKLHPIFDKFVNAFSVLFAFMVASWSGERLLETGKNMIDKAKDRITHPDGNADIAKDGNENLDKPKVPTFDTIKNKILNLGFVKKRDKLHKFVDGAMDKSKTFFKTARVYLPLILGVIAAITTIATQHDEKKKAKMEAKAAQIAQKNNQVIGDDLIYTYINTKKVDQNIPAQLDKY